jgi:hypothetical protein
MNFSKIKFSEEDKNMALQRLKLLLEKKCCICLNNKREKIKYFNLNVLNSPIHFACSDCYHMKIISKNNIICKNVGIKCENKEDKSGNKIYYNDLESFDSSLKESNNNDKKFFCNICFTEHLISQDSENKRSKKGNKLDGIFKKISPKALIQGKNLYSKDGKKLDGTYENLEDKTKGDELYDKNKNKLDGTYKKIAGDIPKEDVYDEYGHADGMVRYMGEGRVLLNNYCDFDKALRKKLLSALKVHFDISELHYGTYTDKSWAYINFLHVGQHIFIPTMEDKLIEKAFRQIAEAFPECECHSIWGCESIVQEGGALNCTTWNVLMDLPIEEESKELPKTSTICLQPNL